GCASRWVSATVRQARWWAVAASRGSRWGARRRPPDPGRAPHGDGDGPAREGRGTARPAAPHAAPDAAGAALRGKGRRGVRARQDRRLLSPVHRAGGGGRGVPRRAPRRRLRDLLLPRARPGVGARRPGERGDGGTVRQGDGLLAGQGAVAAPVRRRPAVHGRPRDRRRSAPARRGTGVRDQVPGWGPDLSLLLRGG